MNPIFKDKRYTTIVHQAHTTDRNGIKYVSVPIYAVYDNTTELDVIIPNFNPMCYDDVYKKAIEMNEQEEAKKIQQPINYYKDFKLISMREFVFLLRNRTTSELCKDFDRNFASPTFHPNNIEKTVVEMTTIDAIQWLLTGEYAKFLSIKLEREHFDSSSNKCLFLGFEEQETRDERRFYYKFNNQYTIQNDEFGLIYYDSSIKIQRINIVEDLLGLNDLHLTEFAIKKIFGY